MTTGEAKISAVPVVGGETGADEDELGVDGDWLGKVS